MSHDADYEDEVTYADLAATYRHAGSPRIPSSPSQDRTLAFTVGKWGGFYRIGGAGCWRICIGPLAITYLRAEFANVMEAWLDKLYPQDSSSPASNSGV